MNGVGGEVGVGRAVDGHFYRKEKWSESGGDGGVMVTERWVLMGGRDGGRLARLGVRAVYDDGRDGNKLVYTELTKYCYLQQGCGLFLRLHKPRTFITLHD